jgi:GDP-L-fucose synthase
LRQDALAVELPLNIGIGHDVSIRELAELIAGVIGYRGELRWDRTKPDGAPRKLLDSTRIQSLGWKPHIELAEGLSETYRWYVNHVESATTSMQEVRT